MNIYGHRYSSADFKTKAKNYYWSQGIGRYVLLYNESSQTLYTFLVQKNSITPLPTPPPEDPIFSVLSSSTESPIIGAIIVSTRREFQDDFDKHMDFINSGAEKNTLELDYPSTGSGSATGYLNYIGTNGTALLLQAWALPRSNLGWLSWKGYSHISIKFSNGDVVTLRVAGFRSAAELPILFVVDKDGKNISLNGAGSTITNFNGGGFGSSPSPNGYTTFSWPIGVTICYGSCPIRSGYVIIRRVSK